MSTQTNLPESNDILVEVPSAGDSMQFDIAVEDTNIDKMLAEIEECYIDRYYHEAFI